MAAALLQALVNLANDHEQVVPVTVFVAVLCLCLVIGHLLEENRWVNESITAIIIVRTILRRIFLFSIFVDVPCLEAPIELSIELGCMAWIERQGFG